MVQDSDRVVDFGTLTFDSKRLTVLLVFLVTGFLSLNPVLWLIYGSFWSGLPGTRGNFTLDNYLQAFWVDGKTTFEVFVNSLTYSITSTTLSIILGIFLSLVLTRTDLRHKNLFRIGLLVTLMVPNYIYAIAFIYIIGAQGLLNQTLMWILTLHAPPFQIFSMPAIIIIDAFLNTPVAYLIIGAAMSSMDVSLEEAARVHGYGTLRTLYKIVLPMLRPAIFATYTLIFIRTIENFELPAILGLPGGIYVFTTQIYRAMVQYPPQVGESAALSIFLLGITIVLILAYRHYTRATERFVSITGKAQRPSLIKLGKWRLLITILCVIYLITTVILPVGMLFYASLCVPSFNLPTLQNLGTFRLSFDYYVSILSNPTVLRAFSNSLFLAVFGASVTILFTALLSYVNLRVKFRGKIVMELLAFLPFAFPGIVIAVGLVWAYIQLPIITHIPIMLYGTIWILLVAYMTRYIPYGIRATSSNLIQIHRDLEDAASTLGAPWHWTFRKIVLPLMKQGMLGGWIVLMAFFLRELSSSILLYQGGTEVISVVLFLLYGDGRWELVNVIGILTIIPVVCLIALAQKLTKAELTL